ncbi:MAG TPA: CvpA family protein [Chloroflexia bacterium]|nr:CvpA family protein [Chloroflexia bacterium]
MLLDDIYVMWIPILVVALMGALGAWRGVYREIAVSASIVLSALIVVQWATRDRWASDLSATFSGLGAGEWQFFLTLVLMVLIVSVVGYGLGGLFARRSLSSTPRTLGALLGVANGAALTGWVLRSAYEGLVSRQETSAVYQNPISLGLMVWAGWFPVVLAVIGAIAALVFSLRGDRVASVPDTSQVPAAIVTPTQARPVYIPQAPPPPYSPSPPPLRTDPYATLPTDAQSTMFMPTREQAANTPTAVHPVTSPSPPPATLAPHQPLGAIQYPPFHPGPPTATSKDNSPDVTEQQSSTDDFHAALRTPPSDTPHTPPFGYDLAALWGTEESDSTLAGDSDASSSPGPASEQASPEMSVAGDETTTSPGEVRCRNCGNPLQEDALFCTECGTRV